MKILLVHPGASWSVADVWRGIKGSFEDAGVEVVQYALDGRIEYSGAWLNWLYKRRMREDNWKGPPPTQGDYVYLACQGLLERALNHRVDWVFIISGSYIHPKMLWLLREAGIKVSCLFTESPYQDEEETIIAKVCQAVWTNERTSIGTYSPICPIVNYYQHAVDPERHKPGPFNDDTAAHDVVFVGTGFVERCELFSGINWDGIDLGLYGTWVLLGSRNRLRQHLVSRKDLVIDNAKTAQLYRNAKIGVNHHRTSMGFGRKAEHITAAESMGPRGYELAATGTFFLSDRRAEVAEIFSDLVPTYDSPEELEDLIRYWLPRETERRQIAEALPAAVKMHTFDDRVEKILDVLVYN